MMETWHEPPPWTAVPTKAKGCRDPKGMMFVTPPVWYVPEDWHGKSLPSGWMGPLWRAGTAKGLGSLMVT